MNLNPAELLNPIFNALDALIQDYGVYLYLVFVWLSLWRAWILSGGLLRKRSQGNSATVVPGIIFTTRLPIQSPPPIIITGFGEASIVIHMQSSVFPFVSIHRQRLKTRDYVEQFLVNACLTQMMESAMEVLLQFINVLIGALHRGQTAGVLAREGFSARPKKRNEKIFADERAQSHCVAAHDFGQHLRRPGNFGESLLPWCVERQ